MNATQLIARLCEASRLRDFTILNAGDRIRYDDGQYWTEYKVMSRTTDGVKLKVLSSNEYPVGSISKFGSIEMADWTRSGYFILQSLGSL